MENTDPLSVANRLRSATSSLTNADDLAAVRDYLRELEDIANKQNAESTRPTLNGDPHSHIRRSR